MEKKILDNVSLLEVIRIINVDLIGFEDFNKLKIISDKKPDTVIKVNQDIIKRDLMLQVLKDFGDVKPKNLEFEFTDFLVFGMADNKQTMAAIPLLDIIVSEGMLIDNEDGKSVSGGWSLTSKEWDLIEID